MFNPQIQINTNHCPNHCRDHRGCEQAQRMRQQAHYHGHEIRVGGPDHGHRPYCCNQGSCMTMNRGRRRVKKTTVITRSSHRQHPPQNSHRKGRGQHNNPYSRRRG